MNAGLLGEHLASPRTATKTNQSTALDPSTASRGDSPSQGEFASYVRQDETTSPSEAAETGLAPPPNTDQISTDKQARAVSAELLVRGETDISNTPKPPPQRDSSVDAETFLTPAASTDADGALNADRAIPAAEIVSQDPRVRAHSDGEAGIRREPRGQPVKLLDPAVDGVTETRNTATREADLDLPSDSIDRFRAGVGRPDAELVRTPISLDQTPNDVADLQLRPSVNTEATPLDRLTTTAVPRDISIVTAEPGISVGAATGSTPSTVTPAGLTPIAPSIPLATPNELTSIIVNAINNGLDPQEQLVVQLDPPELGRVMIDFKFDAQGLQQIIVTTENTEALKRLREMHFELTQALRDHGLSEQNMTFQDHAGEQSQDAWQSQDHERQEVGFVAAEQRRDSASATSTKPGAHSRDQLDLLL